MAFGRTVLERHVLSLDVAQLVQPFQKGFHESAVLSRNESEKTNPVRFSRLLRPRREWQCGSRATEQRDELAPSDESCHLTLQPEGTADDSTPEGHGSAS